jgi:hypothetical protein
MFVLCQRTRPFVVSFVLVHNKLINTESVAVDDDNITNCEKPLLLAGYIFSAGSLRIRI